MYFARWTGNTLDWQQTLGEPTGATVGFTGELNYLENMKLLNHLIF